MAAAALRTALGALPAAAAGATPRDRDGNAFDHLPGKVEDQGER